MRRDQRKINQLRRELTLIENELEESLTLSKLKDDSNVEFTVQKEEGERVKNSLLLNEETLLNLLETHPQLAISIIEKGYGIINKK